jgi:hypothetical protein
VTYFLIDLAAFTAEKGYTQPKSKRCGPQIIQNGNRLKPTGNDISMRQVGIKSEPHDSRIFAIQDAGMG